MMDGQPRLLSWIFIRILGCKMKKIELHRSAGPPLILLLTVLITFPIMYLVFMNTSNDSLENARVIFLFEFVKLFVLILYIIGFFFPVMYLIRNRKGKGNEIIFDENYIIIPNNYWIINPFLEKEVKIELKDISNIKINDQTENFKFKELIIISNLKSFKINNKILSEGDFDFIFQEIKKIIKREGKSLEESSIGSKR